MRAMLQAPYGQLDKAPRCGRLRLPCSERGVHLVVVLSILHTQDQQCSAQVIWIWEFCLGSRALMTTHEPAACGGWRPVALTAVEIRDATRLTVEAPVRASDGIGEVTWIHGDARTH